MRLEMAEGENRLTIYQKLTKSRQANLKKAWRKKHLDWICFARNGLGGASGNLNKTLQDKPLVNPHKKVRLAMASRRNVSFSTRQSDRDN